MTMTYLATIFELTEEPVTYEGGFDTVSQSGGS